MGELIGALAIAIVVVGICVLDYLYRRYQYKRRYYQQHKMEHSYHEALIAYHNWQKLNKKEHDDERK